MTETIKIETGLTGDPDKDALMLHACMTLLVDYVEQECHGLAKLEEWTAEIREMENTEEQQRNQTEVAAIYRWWTVDRARDWELLERNFSVGSWKLEQKLDQRDNEMLKRLVDVRLSLWT